MFKVGLLNKVVFKFNEDEVFLPPQSFQFNCTNLFIQLDHLHALDKPGMLIAHVFGAHENAYKVSNSTDDEVTEYILIVLKQEFFDKTAMCLLAYVGQYSMILTTVSRR